MQMLSADEAAKRLGLASRSLGDKRFRVRLGLPATKIGGKIGFEESDVDRLIKQGREKLPTTRHAPLG